MSLQSFISKIWGKIATLFGSIPAELQQSIHIGVVVTENLKKLVDSPVADVLTAIIPGDIDDKIKQTLRAVLPSLLVRLKLIESTSQSDDPATLMKNAIAAFQALDPGVAPAFMHSLSVLIAQAASDGKLTWSDGVYLLQWYYQNKYKAA